MSPKASALSGAPAPPTSAPPWGAPVELAFRGLVVQQFRNLERLVYQPGPRLNVIAGDNGQGKTSLLEALYLAATSRSFRTERLAETVRQGSEVASVRAEIVEGGLGREQVAQLSATRRTFTLDGKRPSSSAWYATRTPVVVFHPRDLELAHGPAQVRRTLLDRVALHLDPPSLAARAAYQRALRERQRALQERGPRAPELDAFEAVAAEQGARVSLARARAAEALGAALVPAFATLAAADLTLTVEHRPAGTPDAARFLLELGRRRPEDAHRGTASFGPQRDDLELTLGGRAARSHASQGQQRVLALALKLGELACVRDARGAHPVLLLDDVSSELDPERTGAVYALVRATPGQVFVTTTRPELFVTPDAGPEERRDGRLQGGRWVEDPA